ncbi:hypothetical protein [Streptomyces sp. NPDC005805]|uniref:hypothetical protein n=1 Tax=Streptomyces sp. NPDC005805 TaxID=3157068 RepID=UPI0033C0CBAF
MKDDQVVRLPRRGPDAAAPHPGATQAGPVWPQWREDHPAVSGEGLPYVLAALRMTVPAGRSWQQRRLVENDRLRTRLVPLFGALPMSHSLLQEPHGGQHCRYSDRALRLWQDADPDRWPNTLYRDFAEADGPRTGLGELTVTLRLETRDGQVSLTERTIAECNVRADGRLLLTQVPDRLTAEG